MISEVEAGAEEGFVSGLVACSPFTWSCNCCNLYNCLDLGHQLHDARLEPGYRFGVFITDEIVSKSLREFGTSPASKSTKRGTLEVGLRVLIRAKIIRFSDSTRLLQYHT